MRYKRTDKRTDGRTDGTEIIGPSGKIPGTKKTNVVSIRPWMQLIKWDEIEQNSKQKTIYDVTYRIF